MFSKEVKLHSWLLILAALLFFGLNSQANTFLDEPKENNGEEFKYEDESLLSFVDANREISELRREVNEDIDKVLEDVGLTMDRFQQIARASEIGALNDAGYSNEEIEAFNEAAPLITELRQQMRGMTDAILAEHQLSSDLYQEILNDYREDTELQAYVQQLMRDRARERAIAERKKELMEEKDLDEDEIEVILEEEKEEIEEEAEEEID